VRAVDTNVLVFAEIRSSAHHARAAEVLAELADGSAPWGLPWPCIYEFLRVVTHSRVYHPPVPLDRALADLRRILDSPSLILLAETERHTEMFMEILEASGTTGNLIHDARIATLCLEHGVSELVTGDRDFLRFPDLRVHNPFA
jgi:toxin-antitoxin system PIN domain toxin